MAGAGICIPIYCVLRRRQPIRCLPFGVPLSVGIVAAFCKTRRSLQRIVVARSHGPLHSLHMPRLELFPFRYRDPVSRKWVKARYVAERHVIAARYAEWEIVAPPEIREVDANARYFSPHRVTSHAELKQMFEQPPQI